MTSLFFFILWENARFHANLTRSKKFDNIAANLFLCRDFKSLNRKNMSEIAQKVKQIIIEKLGVEESEVTPEASFTNDLGADSLDTVELIMEFEKEFNISIPDDQAENISTVGQAISYLEQNRSEERR